MKDTFFFPHDFGARNDPKLQNVLMDHGCEGLGIFWCVVEHMYEQGGVLPIAYCKCIAFALHVESSIVESVVNDYSLFENDGTNFWSLSINNRLNKRAEIVHKRKKAAINRWNKPLYKHDTSIHDTNAMQMQCKSNAIKEKERKGNIEDKSSIKKEIKKGETAKRFTPPSVEDVNIYLKEKGYEVDAESFVAFYTSKDWMVGKNKMKDWRAALVTWHKRIRLPGHGVSASSAKNANAEWDR